MVCCACSATADRLDYYNVLPVKWRNSASDWAGLKVLEITRVQANIQETGCQPGALASARNCTCPHYAHQRAQVKAQVITLKIMVITLKILQELSQEASGSALQPQHHAEHSTATASPKTHNCLIMLDKTGAALYTVSYSTVLLHAF